MGGAYQDRLRSNARPKIERLLEARRSLAAMEMFSVCWPSRRRYTWFPCGARLASSQASRVSRRTITGLLLGAAKSEIRRSATSSQTRAGRKSSCSKRHLRIEQSQVLHVPAVEPRGGQHSKHFVLGIIGRHFRDLPRGVGWVPPPANWIRMFASVTFSMARSGRPAMAQPTASAPVA